MTNFIENLFSNLFGENVVLATILISIVPLIELKGAIPFGCSKDIWGQNALSLVKSFACSTLGSCLVVPLLALLYYPIIKALKKTKLFKRLATKIENRVNDKKEKLEQNLLQKQENAEQTTNKNKKSSVVKKFFGVFLFVAIPLPLTGVWTGTCLAVALGLNFFQSCSSVILGNILSGIIISIITYFFGDSSIYFFYVFLILIVVAVLFALIKTFSKKKNLKNNT